MKKNISVNLQGMIFHVEEDGYEMLSQYLAAIKTYFSSYEGHEEIVADIESRIAEIFFSRLNPGKQVISREDVQALIAQMGTIADFETVVEPDEAEASTGQAQGATPPPFAAAPIEQKRLYRDVNRKILAGVASGIANYLQMDPIWVRLAFVLLVLGVPFTGGFTLLGVILYGICWVALPENESLPDIPVRKLFRDPVDKKLGGVASGIAIYFGADVAIIRLLFLVFFFIFGIGLLPYILLWIAVPEAKSITERMQMQGNPVTLSSIEESVKNSLHMQDANGQESTLAKVLLFPVRLVSQVIKALSRVLNPLMAALVTIVRVFAGLMMMVVAGSFMVALLVALMVGLGVFEQPEYFNFGEIPASAFFNAVPSWLVWAGFFTGIIPALLLFLLGVGLLAKKFFLRPTVGWSMLGVWLLATAALITGIFTTARYYQESGEYVQEQSFPVAAHNTLVFNIRESSHDYGHRMNVTLEGYNGTDVRLVQTFKSRGLNEEDAIKNAQMITYKLVQQDSVLRFDDAFTFKPNATFRDQDLDLKILVPEGKQLRFSEGFANHFANAVTNGEYNADDLSGNTWQVKEGRLVCLTCSVVDTAAQASGAKPTVAASLDDDLSILKDEYDGVSKIYNVREFEEIEAGGAYHIRVRQSFRHHVRVTGTEKELEKLQLRVQNGVLKIKRDSEFLRLWEMGQQPVLIEVETPDLSTVDISGAAKAEIIGFAPESFTIKQSGASEVASNISTGQLDVDISGAAKTLLKGHADDLAVNASGASHVEASKLVSVRANVDLSGASEGVFNVKERLVAEASGASSVQYLGEVQQVDTNQSGGSHISRKK
ncbi:PspC domain-containing protein [Rufibacter immobilis]|uniref:PspC domain-containing protein n=1 Tax=Rufibacter immobilis TaxID=1348778 RepID=A0A3M9N4R1_9BACT|nr:PspC domain-containing protein [Rufibacter immobilis]RNI31988.1 PspC domain-containing protein [Rufibacter immobilis]